MGNYHVRFCSGSGPGDRPTDPQRSRPANRVSSCCRFSFLKHLKFSLALLRNPQAAYARAVRRQQIASVSRSLP